MDALILFRLIKKAIVIICLLICSVSHAASDESFVETLQGVIAAGQSVTTVDDKYNLPLVQWNAITNLSVDNIISLDLRNDLSQPFFYYNKPFSCTVHLSIQYYTTWGQTTPTTINDVELTVNYDTAAGAAHKAIAQYKFQNAFKVVVTVTSISFPGLANVTPDMMRIRNQILIKRQYPFSATISAPVTIAEPTEIAGRGLQGVGNGKLEISWDPQDFPGAEEFDVEWMFIDKESERAANFNANTVSNITDQMVEGWMRNDNTRVTVNAASYIIDLPYQEGYVLVRVRGAAYLNASRTLRQTTNWQYRENIANAQLAFFATTAHQAELNWQFTGSFAEGGKRKEVVSYFDGTLRSRQMVTINNSDDKAVAAETVYDQMGRPALSILPAPIDDNTLKYYSKLNVNAAGDPFSHTDILLPGQVNCYSTATKIYGTAATPQYYSVNNPFVSSSEFYFSKYVPDADGYNYALTEYTPDNSGRIRRQGGVGQAFQIGNGKETKYYYGKPLQTELYRLFGMEVGNSSHYQKNLVIDANGQASVSYVDANGKTIATALAGTNPANLEELPSALAQDAKKTMNQVLLRSSDFEINAGNLYKQATATFLVAEPGNFQVNYTVDPAVLGSYTDNSNQSFCMNCYYEVKVTVKDECGVEKASKTSAPFTGNNIDCHSPATSYSDNVSLASLGIGEYTVSYTLQLSEQMINSQVDYYINNNKDIKKLQTFLEDELVQADLKGCYNECSTCMVKLGTLTDFTAKMTALFQKLSAEKYSGYSFNPNSGEIQTWIATTYASLYSNCVLISQNCTPASPCEQKLEMMKYDVIPGGQYALYTYNESTGVYSIYDDNTNVLNFFNDGIAEIDALTYIDDYGNTVSIKQNGVYLSTSDFIKQYIQNPQWADAFVKKHIEYCSYEWCMDQTIANAPAAGYKNEDSYRFDEMLRESINDAQTAVNKGYFSYTDYTVLLNSDPFFNGGRGSSYKTSIQNDLSNLSNILHMTLKDANGNTLAAKNIFQLIDWMLYAKPISATATPADMVASWAVTTFDIACRSRTQEWELYRNYYLQIKSKYVEMAKQVQMPDCKNCFVGSDAEQNNCEMSDPGSATCPTSNELTLYSEFDYDNSNNNSPPLEYADYGYKIFLKLLNGASLRPVRVKIKRSEGFLRSGGGGYCNQTIDYRPLDDLEVTIPAGTVSFLIGLDIHKWSADNSTGCYFSFDPFIVYSNPSVLYCDVTPVYPASSCTSDPRYSAYQDKRRIWNEYVNTQGYLDCVATTGATNTPTEVAQKYYDQVVANLDATKEGWRERLYGVAAEESQMSISNATIDNLVNNLYLIAKKNIDYQYALYLANTQPDISMIRPASVLPSGVTASNGYNSFLQAFNAIAGATNVAKGFGPDLLDQPYPYNKVPVLINKNDGGLNADICTRLNQLKTLSGTSTTTAFHDWLKLQLADDYTWSLTELTDALARCTNGCRYLDKPLLFPAVLTAPAAPVSSPWITCSDIATLQSGFTSAYPQVVTNTKLYRLLFTNYINHQSGYALSYDEIAAFIAQCSTNSTAILFNKPGAPALQEDDFGCTANIIADVFSKAGEEYEFYITQEKRRFKNLLIAKCLSTKATAKLLGEQYEYHYTLYYYDQAGNLVKTVPPEGVRFLTDEEIEMVALLSEPSDEECSNAVQYTTASATFAALSTRLTAGDKAVEMWFQLADANASKKIRLVTPDNKYMLQAMFDEAHVWAEVYKLQPNAATDIDILSSMQFVGNLRNGAALTEWNHFVIQSGTSLVEGTASVFFNGISLSPTTGIPFPSDWEINSGPGNYSVPANDISTLRYLRAYNRVLSGSEVLANFANSCLSPVGVLKNYIATSGPLSVWGMMGTSPVDIAQSLRITSGAKALPATNYGITTVSNTFTMELWVNPEEPIQLNPELNTGYWGLTGQQYAIYPYRGETSNNTAGAGISVGTNGVSVAEYADYYMPNTLTWAGSISGWTHIAVVYTNKQPKLYVNGQLVRTGVTSLRTHVYPGYNFTTGDAGWGTYGPMKGLIDEVRIWNSALSQQDIATRMNKSLPVPTAGLLGYWPMNASDGNQALDISGNNYHSAFLINNWEWDINNGSPLENSPDQIRRFIAPAHGLPTNYAYNSQNQVVNQNSPDGGRSEFWYDRLGRLTISQNAEQKTPTGTDAANRFSYTKYDVLGRISEVGEKLNASTLTELQARTTATLESWLASGTNRQVTLTYYDNEPTWVPASLTGTLHNLRKRVALTTLLVNGGDPSVAANRTASSFYSYDLIGNVKTLVQENRELANAEAAAIPNATGLKQIKYDYDLISGKVNKVLYQDGKWDQFYYQYLYDADNRLIKALSSRTNYADPNLWVTEASYRYYLHGPLARMELGTDKVQGVDYTYTLQGWLKGVNSHELDPNKDMSGDGKAGSPFANVARDAYAFSLGYYANDYKAVTTNSTWALNYQYGVGTYAKPLYNGNISTATYALNKISNGATVGYTYRYDQLNRLKEMNQHTIGTGATTWNNSNVAANNAYKEQVSYDANGNILTYKRNAASAMMDDMSYAYNRDAAGRLLNNKLRHVNDAIGTGAFTDDIDNQSADNYQYDKIGNLVSDPAETIESIKWNVYGKIESIRKFKEEEEESDINYIYDAGGNRIAKKYHYNTLFTMNQQIVDYTDYYVRDAQGNVMAIYKLNNLFKTNGMPNGSTYAWKEQHLYGSSRIGMFTAEYTVSGFSNDSYSATNDPALNGFKGKRIYELSNHLGNVLTTISDRKIGHDAGNGTVDYYIAEVLSQNDYYPFGMLMKDRKYSAGTGYRYGFNGKENDNEVKGEGNQQDYGMRIYDPRLGRFLSVDPMYKQYPMLTPYQYASNRPIDGIDLDGLEWVHFNIKFKRNSEGEMVVIEKTMVKDYRNLSEEQMRKVHAMGYRQPPFYTQYSQGFGKRGRGVLFTYEEYDQNGKIISRQEKMDVVSGLTKHGFYAGQGCITQYGELITPGKFGNYDFGMKPIDMGDALAKMHDLLQNVPNHKGYQHEDYLNSDIIFLSMMARFKSEYEKNPDYVDPFTGRKVSAEQKAFVDNAITLFKLLVISKVEKLKQKFDKGDISKAEFDEKTKLYNSQGVVDYIALPTPTDKVNKDSK